MTASFVSTLLLSLLVTVTCPAPVTAQDALDVAMGAELARSRELKDEGYPPPYYVSLAVADLDRQEEVCAMGRERYSARRRQRVVSPDVRVGSRAMDNHPVMVPSGFVGRALPYESDVFAIRHGLWQMLDQAYKAASADFLRKQALRVSRGKTEYDTDDLSLEAPGRKARIPGGDWSGERLLRACLETSRAFRAAPGLLHAEVSTTLSREVWRLRDTEGMEVDFARGVAEIELEALDISTEGMKIYAADRFVATAEKALPGLGVLREAAAGMVADLAALKVAKTTSPFDAPAILDPSVAAAIVLSVGTRLSGEEQRNPAGTQVFRDKLGKLVLPPRLTIVDDPTVEEFGGRPLAGSYAVDHQGVPAQRVTLVERGVLRGFLLSRYPVIGFPKSNGHARRAAGTMPIGAPGNLFLEVEGAVSEDRLFDLLRRELKRRGKPYGLWVRKLRDFSQQRSTGGQDSLRLSPRLVYLVEAATGKRTLVRDLDVVGTPLVMLESIIAAGDRRQAVDLMSGVPVSVIAPSLLVGGVELQRSEAKPEKPPILPPPSPQ